MHSCEYSYNLIQSPEIYIFGILFSIISLAGAFGNTLALFVFWRPEMKAVPNRILTSLCFVGALLGFIYLPLMTWDMFDNTSDEICLSSLPRTMLSVSLLGTSTLNVCLIAYERFVVLKSVAEYRERMEYKKTMVLIALSWILPAVGLLLSYVASIDSLAIVMGVFFLSPFVILAVIYILLKVFILSKEKKLREHQNSVEIDRRTTRKTIIDITSQYRHLKIARKVTLLALLYCCCMMPLTCAQVWTVMIKLQITHRTRTYEIFYLFSTVVALSMICIHLILYTFKYPDFQNSLRKLLGISMGNPTK